jgi:hypothetical protein
MMFAEADIKKIKELLRKDIELLKHWNLMDYSLLLAVEHVGDAPAQSHLDSAY